MNTPEVIDLFAGPGGWDEGLRMLGVTNVLGVEFEKNACATAEAAGHERLLADIADTNPHTIAERVTGLIGSPPCPGFSAAGKGLGRKDFELLLWAIGQIGDGRPVDETLDAVRAQQNDHRSALTLEPLRWALALDPEWITLEQVPTVLPLWQAYAQLLATRGYSVWTGNLQAEQYGVPQTRKRAVLIASRTQEATQPVPTHSRYYPRTPDKLDPGVEKWVSMADALGWGLSRRPSPTITGGGTETGGAEPIAKWDRYTHRPDFIRMTKMPNSAQRTLEQPAPTMAFGHDSASCRWFADGEPIRRITVVEAATLQSFPSDYPWQGGAGQQFQQVGNAVPPLLAAHVLAAVGVGQLESEVAA